MNNEPAETAKSTAYYYLPQDVQDYIAKQAAKDNRSPSNYLTTLIRRIRDTVDPQ